MTKPSDDLIDLSYFDPTTANVLRRRGISTHGALRICTEADIEALPHVGPQRAARFKTYMAENGLRLRTPEESFQSIAEEVYGDILHTPIEMLVIHLLNLFVEDGDAADEPGHALRRLHEQGFVIVEDLRRISGGDLRMTMFRGQSYYALRGWLLGMNISVTG